MSMWTMKVNETRSRYDSQFFFFAMFPETRSW